MKGGGGLFYPPFLRIIFTAKTSHFQGVKGMKRGWIESGARFKKMESNPFPLKLTEPDPV